MENIDIIELVEFLLGIVQAFDGAGFFGQMCTNAAQKHNILDARLLYRLDNIGPDLIVVTSEIICCINRWDQCKDSVGAFKDIC